MDTTPLHLDTVMSLAAAGAQRRYPKRTLLFQEGDLSDDLYVLLSGRVEVYLADADGRRIVVDILEPVTYFGEMALDGRRRSASVMTLEDSRLSIIRRDQFRNFLVDHPDAAFELVVTLIQRARNLTRVVGDLALLDARSRILHYLADHACRNGDRQFFGERITQRELAERNGMSREMVSRVMAQLRAEGCIATHPDGAIEILGNRTGD